MITLKNSECFGKRPNLSLALCSKFQLRDKKKLIEGRIKIITLTLYYIIYI